MQTREALLQFYKREGVDGQMLTRYERTVKENEERVWARQLRCRLGVEGWTSRGRSVEQ